MFTKLCVPLRPLCRGSRLGTLYREWLRASGKVSCAEFPYWISPRTDTPCQSISPRSQQSLHRDEKNTDDEIDFELEAELERQLAATFHPGRRANQQFPRSR